jgi:hypothetical protein
MKKCLNNRGKYVKISIHTGISEQRKKEYPLQRKSKFEGEKKNVYCQRRSDDAGMYSVTGRVGRPDTNADADVLLFVFANGTN